MVEGLGIEPSSYALQAYAEITRLAHPPKFSWGGWSESNRHLTDPQSGALPLCYNHHKIARRMVGAVGFEPYNLPVKSRLLYH